LQWWPKSYRVDGVAKLQPSDRLMVSIVLHAVVCNAAVRAVRRSKLHGGPVRSVRATPYCSHFDRVTFESCKRVTSDATIKSRGQEI